jgi:hypothetical protein
MLMQPEPLFRDSPEQLGIPEHAFELQGLPCNPVNWWADYGKLCPDLQRVSKLFLSIPPSAAGGERNWSVWSHVWSSKRACMSVGRVAMLVYVYFNSRVLQRQAQVVDFEQFVDELCEEFEGEGEGVAAEHAEQAVQDEVLVVDDEGVEVEHIWDKPL